MAERKPTVNALEAAADELDRPPTANWVLADACLLAANFLMDESSLDFSALTIFKKKRFFILNQNFLLKSSRFIYLPRCC
jgi:hypothetical protein